VDAPSKEMKGEIDGIFNMRLDGKLDLCSSLGLSTCGVRVCLDGLVMCHHIRVYASTKREECFNWMGPQLNVKHA
jgi:hypothetical protein